jgi:GGDEF domain-containing protein
VAIYPDNGQTAEQLVKIADAAMYLAKQGGKNRYRFISG